MDKSIARKVAQRIRTMTSAKTQQSMKMHRKPFPEIRDYVRSFSVNLRTMRAQDRTQDLSVYSLSRSCRELPNPSKLGEEKLRLVLTRSCRGLVVAVYISKLPKQTSTNLCPNDTMFANQNKDRQSYPPMTEAYLCSSGSLICFFLENERTSASE